MHFSANSGIHQHWVTLLPDGAAATGSGVEIRIAADKSLPSNAPNEAAEPADGVGMCFAGRKRSGKSVTREGMAKAQARAIIAFLGFCKRSHAPASIILIQSYLARMGEQEANTARTALRWFVRSAERATGDRLTVDGRRRKKH